MILPFPEHFIIVVKYNGSMRAMTQSLALTLHGPPLQPPRVFEKQLHS